MQGLSIWSVVCTLTVSILLFLLVRFLLKSVNSKKNFVVFIPAICLISLNSCSQKDNIEVPQPSAVIVKSDVDLPEVVVTATALTVPAPQIPSLNYDSGWSNFSEQLLSGGGVSTGGSNGGTAGSGGPMLQDPNDPNSWVRRTNQTSRFNSSFFFS